MGTRDTSLDITVRGGIINVPPSNIAPGANRHQPNTPVNKKFAPQKSTPKKRKAKPKPEVTDELPEELE